MTGGPVVVCAWRQGTTTSEVEELLTFGRQASEALGTELRLLVLGPWIDGAAEAAGKHGVDGVDRAESPKLEDFQPDPYVEALAQYCARYGPRVLLFSQTFDARLVAPRLAGRLGAGVAMNALDLQMDDGGTLEVIASAHGGDTRAVYALGGPGPHIVAVLPGRVAAEPAATPATSPLIQSVDLDLEAVEERIRVIEPARAEGPRLEDAQTIVAGGRGLGSPEHYRLIEQLAEAMGGLAAASRPIVDDGWADPSRQIGLTGKMVRPALYVAVGVSGASQHMAGCSAAKTIVAINSDREAAIFRYARYGIVGDCLEIVPELIRALQNQ